MNQADVLKNAIMKGIKKMTLNSNLINVFSDIDGFQIGDSGEIFSNLEFANNIKEYIEKILISQLENKLSEISDIHKMTWKIDAYNIAKEVLDSPKVSSLKQNLDNILENCLTQIRSELMKHEPVPVFEKKDFQPYFPLRSAEAPIQPIQTKFSELSQFTLTTKPANIRIKAYELLISSHYADTVTKTNWTELQQTIQEGLMDNNMDVFKLCLKLHAKLLSCSSFEIVKDIFLNLLESLCKHYNDQESEYEIISFNNYIHYRMISIGNLIINTTKLITQNVARFGTKRLEEIIDNLVHLLSIHYSSKSIRRKHLLSPFEIISCLDPMGRWCVYFTHGVITRNILLNSNCNKARNNLLQIIVEELITWFSNPIIPDELNVDLNSINSPQVKFAVFTHSLSIFVTICSYEMGRAFFPLFINKHEESVTISAITEKVILFLNGKIKKELGLNKTFSSGFIDFVVACANKLLIIRENQTTLLQAVLNPLQQIPPNLFSHTLSILNLIPQCECDKHFFMKNLTLGRKRGSQLNRASVSAHCFRNKQCRSSSEQQNTLCTENNSTCISDVLVNGLTLILEDKNTEYPNHLVSQLIYVFGKFLIQNDGLCSILTKENVYKISHILVVIHRAINLEENFKNVTRTQVIDINRACQDFFLQIGATPLGAYLTKEENILDFILREALENPEIPWTCTTWRLFTSHCCQYIGEENALATQNSNLVKQQLLKLWDVIDTNCSGSDLHIQLAVKNFLIVVTSFGCSMNGVKAMFLEPAEGSDVTLTDQTEVRPTSIATLIQYLALSVDDIYDTTFHQIALSVLQIFVSNLDTNLYLQQFLRFQEHLLQLQSNNRIDESSDIIIDECSTLRHAILEQSYFTRHVRTDIKLYCTPPQGTSTLHRVKMKPKFNGELPKFLQDTRTCLHDMNWLKQARKVYRASVAENIKGTTLQDTLEQVKKCLPETNVGIKWAAAEEKLFDEDVLGIQFVIRYGANNRLLQPTQQNADNLGHLICLARAGVGSQLDKFTGFDWFVATVFLICSGNIERCQNFLSCIRALPTANYIWSSLISNGDKGFAVLGQLLDSILANELPCGFYTLQTNGMSWWLICRQWIRECFWNLLDWNLICHWLMLCILQQPDYIIYFCTALLHVNEQYILKLSREGNLYQIITNPIGKFQMTDIFPFMDNLCKRYHHILSCKINSLL